MLKAAFSVLLLPVVALLSITSPAKADLVEIADFSDNCCFVPFNPAKGLSIGVFDIGGNGVALSSNPNAFPVYPTVDPSARLGITSGPLIGSTGNTSIYASGKVSYSGGFVQIPNGTTCADFGWVPYQVGLGQDCIPNLGLGGSTGIVTLTYGDIVSRSTDVIYQEILVTTPVTFDITPDLAFALGISIGPYVGSFELQGVAAESYSNGSIVTEILTAVSPVQVIGVTAPEPSSIALLAAVIGGLLAGSWFRRKKTGLRHPIS